MTAFKDFKDIKIYEGKIEDRLSACLAGRPFILVTSKGWLKRGLLEKIAQSGIKQDDIRVIWSEVPDNPTDVCIFDAYEKLSDINEDIAFVGIGGGSVMDATKGLAFFAALRGDKASFAEALRSPDKYEGLAEGALKSLIMVPTTSGTGSEVTRWATIWGEDGRKFSLSQYGLYPQEVIFDASLCLSMPRHITLASGLDALSHACEAIWNRNASTQSDAFAVKAIELLSESLPLALEHGDEVDIRRNMQLSSYLAGCAMSLTRTALAHSISYPLTGRYGLMHGFACSFTLPEIAAFNARENPERCQMIAGAMKKAAGHEDGRQETADLLIDFLEKVGLAKEMQKHFANGHPANLEELELINPSRAGNNLRAATRDDAYTILSRSMTLMGV